jgi:hypothetical protein
MAAMLPDHTDLLSAAGWQTIEAVVRRIGTEEGLKVPAKQPSRGRLRLHDGSCVRLGLEAPNHVLSYDFVQGHTYCPLQRRHAGTSSASWWSLMHTPGNVWHRIWPGI